MVHVASSRPQSSACRLTSSASCSCTAAFQCRSSFSLCRRMRSLFRISCASRSSSNLLILTCASGRVCHEGRCVSHSATQTWQADPETCLWIAWISSIRQSLTSPRPHSAPAMLILSLSPARFLFLRRLRPAPQAQPVGSRGSGIWEKDHPRPTDSRHWSLATALMRRLTGTGTRTR